MLDLLHARLRNFDFPLGCLRRLLDERVQHDDATPNQSAEENPRDVFGTFEPQLEQTIPRYSGAPSGMRDQRRVVLIQRHCDSTLAAVDDGIVECSHNLV